MRMPPGEECVWADGRILQSLQKEVQQALQLGKASESRGGLGASQGGESDFLAAAFICLEEGLLGN